MFAVRINGLELDTDMRCKQNVAQESAMWRLSTERGGRIFAPASRTRERG
jgi:hypothetical protein